MVPWSAVVNPHPPLRQLNAPVPFPEIPHSSGTAAEEEASFQLHK
jgi:hypothetical protein